jgi:hypothetical protein
MNIWGKLGKEYYSWHIGNINELEEFIIEHNIDVDYIKESYAIISWDKRCFNLKHQINGWYFRNNGNMHIKLVSFSNSCGGGLSFNAIKAVVF